MTTENKMPIDEAEEFLLEEMFVSRTDKKGIIQSGNEVFVRVSGYGLKELIKKPHNIIRHKDMPKAVFKLLWSRLKAELPTFAYVKNLSKSGKYYWVLAAVFPLKDGYLSVRIKPSSEVLKTVLALYSSTLALELEKGMEEGEQFLLRELAKLGFSDYDKFMLTAMQEELAFKAANGKSVELVSIDGVADKRLFKKITDLKDYAALANSEIQKTSTQIASLQKRNHGFLEHALKVKGACTRLQYLSSNMSITAHKFGKEGGSLAVVAASYQAATQRVQRGLDAFCSSLGSVIAELDRSLVDVLCLRMQIEMINFEIEQAERAIAANEVSENFSIEKRIDDLGELLHTVHGYFVSANDGLVVYCKKIKTAQGLCRDISKILLNIDLIRTGGLIEGSRTDKVEKSFQPFMEELSSIISTVQSPVEEIANFLTALDGGYSSAMAFSRRTEFFLSKAMNLHTIFLAKKHEQSATDSVSTASAAAA